MKAADVVICPMKTSITHTRAKIEAAEAGAERIATMPGIAEEMFAMGAMTADYSCVMALTEQVTDLLTNANTARIEKDGHVLTLDLRGRRGVSSPGVYEKGQAGNLPSGESYIAPIRTGANGTMVIDGSMVESVYWNKFHGSESEGRGSSKHPRKRSRETGDSL